MQYSHSDRQQFLQNIQNPNRCNRNFLMCLGNRNRAVTNIYNSNGACDFADPSGGSVERGIRVRLHTKTPIFRYIYM